MLKIIFLVLTTTLYLCASANFAPNEDCKACHPLIYKEFSESMHANSTPQKDPIHKSVWAKHPQNLKLNKYGCGKCHTPTAQKNSIPTADSKKHQEGISCAYCHRIKDIKIDPKSNINITTSTEKKYFGTLQDHIDSPYHAIATKGNEHMKNGNVCIGCHSHKMNKHKLNVCSTNIDNEMDGANCVSCHMPKVKGSVSNLNERKEHTFHGFAGSHSNQDMLSKYVKISILRQMDGFIINIDNHSSHALLLHPLRVAVLKVNVTRDNKTIKLKSETFVRVIGHNGKPAMPWKASTTLKDTMIQANEKRDVKYDFKLQTGDKVDVTLGWFLVNPKALKMLELEDEDIATKFIEFKKESFNF
jgi:hypothetical protein